MPGAVVARPEWGGAVLAVFHSDNEEALVGCVHRCGRLVFQPTASCLGEGLGGALSCRRRLAGGPETIA